MKNKKENVSSYSPKEIAVFLNNAVQACLNPQGKSFSSLRRQKLREYVLAFLEPALEHLQEFEEEGKVFPAPLTSEELTSILTSAALFVHLNETLCTDKVPMAGIVSDMFGEKENV